jgi:ADP-ribosyl-[dinitrogen reductase] hydrolase
MPIDTTWDLDEINANLPPEEPLPERPPAPDDGLPPAQGGEPIRDASDAVLGCLLGTAAGDAIGVPREGLSRTRARRLLGPAPLQYRFLGHRGMVSEGTEHACFTAQALIEAEGDIERFSHHLARQLQLWLLGVPASIGRATLHVAWRLWLGWPPERSGISSASNGPAMRAPLIGAYAADDADQLTALVRASTALTHMDPRAEQASLLLALAAQRAAQSGPVPEGAAFVDELRPRVTNAHLGECLSKVAAHLRREARAEELADALGLEDGVTDFISDTVPVALFCWLRYPWEFRPAVEEAVLLGGDTGATGAIVGALAGTALGIQGIPIEWLRGLLEWPHSVEWMRELATRLAESRWPSETPVQPLPHRYPAVFARNLLFLGLTLAHTGRRLLPPR